MVNTKACKPLFRALYRGEREKKRFAWQGRQNFLATTYYKPYLSALYYLSTRSPIHRPRCYAACIQSHLHDVCTRFKKLRASRLPFLPLSLRCGQKNVFLAPHNSAKSDSNLSSQKISPPPVECGGLPGSEMSARAVYNIYTESGCCCCCCSLYALLLPLLLVWRKNAPELSPINRYG